MPAAADKFSMLAALKPARPMPARPAAIRTPGEEDTLSRILGAGVATNHFGEHLTIRNWFSTPEFAGPSSTTLELLSRTRDESLSRKTRAALQDSEKWLFLDTETTGLAGGTGTYAFLIGVAWWDAGGLQAEQFFMRDFAEEHSCSSECSSAKSRIKNCSACNPPASHHATPIRKAYVPVPPARPVVSVSRKSHFSGFSNAARVLRESDSSRVRESNSSVVDEGPANSGVENQFRMVRCSPK